MDDLRADRLVLRRYRDTEEDLAFLQDLHGRLEVARWLGDGRPQPTREQARARLDRYLALDDPVRGIWAITDAGSGRLLGTLLLKGLPASTGHPAPGVPGPDSGHTEIGWHLHPDAWGRGVATRAARAVLDHAWRGGLDHVLAVTHPDNRASQAVAHRIGMRDVGLTHDFYDAETWLLRADRPASKDARTARRCLQNHGAGGPMD